MADALSQSDDQPSTTREGLTGAAFPVVGVGASAGGLEALQQFFKALPTDTGMAFVVVQHLSPDDSSSLADLVARATAMQVTAVAGESVVQQNRVYVLPPARDIIIGRGTLSLLPQRHENSHVIDRFFRSLAEDSAHLAIGVVLSGGLSDGTMGLEEIKAAGGVTFAQDETAQDESMPRSAAASGCVDYMLPPERIAQVLARIAHHAYVTKKDEADIEDNMDGASHGAIVELVRGTTGVDFSHYKASTLRRRITRRMMLHRLETPRDYEEHLRATPDEIELLYQDILISVTSFFRDPEAFEALARDVFPKLLAAQTLGEPVRFWVAGCSSGEEVYSLAMVFTECAEAKGGTARLQLFGTDVNPRCVEKARAGWYPQSIANDVSPERLQRFFTEEGGGYRVRKSVRERCIFSRHNLLADPPFSRVDLISCRNLLIYLEPVLQQRVMPIFHYALKPAGWLWLGSSESVGTARTLFEAGDLRHKTFTRRPGGGGPVARVFTQMPGPLPELRQPGHGALHRDAERLLLAKYAPPGVVVSTSLDIVQFQGDTSPYLAPASGVASHHLLKMLREGLAGGVREALQRAEQQGGPVRTEGLRVRSNGAFHSIDIEVIPIAAGAGRSGGFVVLFDGERRAAAVGIAARLGAWWKKMRRREPGASRLAHDELALLTQELAATRDSLQAVSEQHEAVAEELRSANEEAQSANEEMQSVNEELETSKEEMEATNEELATLNEELAQRNADLSRAGEARARLAAIVDSSDDAIIGKNLDGIITNWNRGAERIFGYTAAEIVGQSVLTLIPRERHAEEEVILGHVRRGEPLEHFETVRQRKDGTHFHVSLTASPIVDEAGKIVGVSKIARDITARKQNEDDERAELAALRTLQEFSARLIREENPAELHQHILDAAIAIMSAEMASLQVLDGTGENLEMLAWRGFHPDSAVFWQTVRTASGSSCGLALARGERFMAGDIETCAEMAGTEDLREYRRSGILAVQSTPLRSRTGRLLGMISTHWREAHQPSERDFRLFDLLARQVADILEREEGVAALRTKEDQFRGLAENILHLAWTAHADGFIHWYNRRWYEYTGTTPQQMEGWGWQSVHDPAGLPGVLERWKASIATGQQFEMVFPLRGADGQFRPFLTRVDPVKDAEGRVRQWIGTNTEITELRATEDALRRSEQRFRTAVSIVSSLIWTNNSEGKMVGEQPGWANFTGQTQEEYQDYGWAQAVHPEDAQATIEAWRQAVAEKKVFAWEHRVRRADGEWRMCAIRAVPMLSAEGAILEWVGVHTDITERQQAEKSLIASTEQLRLIADTAPVLIAHCDREHRYLFVNAPYAARFGLRREEVIGRSLAEVVGKAAYESIRPHVERVLTGEAVEFEIPIPYEKLGTQWMHASYAPERDASGSVTGFVGVIVDITERKRAELNLVFLAAISDELVALESVDEIMRKVGAKIGAHFQLSLCNFVEIDDAAGESEVTHEWRSTGVPSTLGVHKLSEWVTGDFQQSCHAGQVFVVRDTTTDPRVDAARHAAVKVRAYICVPLVRDGAWRFLLNLHDCEPREWREDEIALMREVTTRIWARLERARGEQTLRANEALFSTIIEQAPGGVYVVDEEFRVRDVNAQSRAVFAAVEPVIGRDFAETLATIWPPEVAGEFITIFRRTLATGESYLSPGFTAQRADTGEEESYEWEAHRITLPNGRRGVVCYYTDTTERQRLEAALRASEARATGIVQSIADGFITLDTEWRVTYLSARGAEILAPLQKTTTNVLGKDHWQEFPATVGTIVEESYRRAAREQVTVQFENFYAPLERWLDIRAYPSALGLTIYFLDITERKAADEALRRSQQALAEQAEALRAADRSKNEFLAMLAHELRNPLAPLRNSAALLQIADASADERVQAQRILTRQIENMSRMIDDLLDISRITEGKIELRKKAVSLEAILTAATSLARSGCAARHQELTLTLPPEPIWLEADATRLEQVFGNLLNNACKYSGNGCHIGLRAEVVAGGASSKSGELLRNANESEGWDEQRREIVVIVSDDGAGIDPELLPRIFELFVQASRTLDREHGGLGIGLTLVQRLVHLHGGTIEARSEGLGRGAEFIVRLPILTEAPPPAPPLMPTPASRDTARRILIVDDNTDAARSLATLLKRRGHETHTAFTGPEAVTAAANFLPEVVLLDIGLPGMDGFEVARRIRGTSSGIGVLLIAMSGYGRDDDRAEAKLAGFDVYLVKPLDLDALRALLQDDPSP